MPTALGADMSDQMSATPQEHHNASVNAVLESHSSRVVHGSETRTASQPRQYLTGALCLAAQIDFCPVCLHMLPQPCRTAQNPLPVTASLYVTACVD